MYSFFLYFILLIYFATQGGMWDLVLNQDQTHAPFRGMGFLATDHQWNQYSGFTCKATQSVFNESRLKRLAQ